MSSSRLGYNIRRSGMKLRAVAAGASRGMLLDGVVLIVSLTMMSLLTGQFLALVRQANAGGGFARFALFLCAVGMLTLPAAAAILKRWHFHRRCVGKEKEFPLSGCLPIFYFVLSVILSLGVGHYLHEAFSGGGEASLPVMTAAVVAGAAQTGLVFRYFSPPKRPPRAAFLRDVRGERLGDLCVFVNMILFQVVWNVFARVPFGRAGGAGEVAGRLFWLIFLALLIYLPPRIFYLTEDYRRPGAWLTMLLANAPTVLRMMFGANDPNVRG